MFIGPFYFEPFFVFCVCVAAFCGLLYALSQLFESSPPPRPRSPEELDQDAAALRAKSRYLEALAENELKQAHLDEQRTFIRTQLGRR